MQVVLGERLHLVPGTDEQVYVRLCQHEHHQTVGDPLAPVGALAHELLEAPTDVGIEERKTFMWEKRRGCHSNGSPNSRELDKSSSQSYYAPERGHLCRCDRAADSFDVMEKDILFSFPPKQGIPRIWGTGVDINPNSLKLCWKESLASIEADGHELGNFVNSYGSFPESLVPLSKSMCR